MEKKMKLINTLTETAMATRNISGLGEEFIRQEIYKHIEKKIEEFVMEMSKKDIPFTDLSYVYPVNMLPQITN